MYANNMPIQQTHITLQSTAPSDKVAQIGAALADILPESVQSGAVGWVERH